MFLHFWDTRTQKTIREVDDMDFVPRKGDTVCLSYNDALDSGMWEVVDVTWTFFPPADNTEPYVDVELAPYEGGDWKGSADGQLSYQEKADIARLDSMISSLLAEVTDGK